MNIIGSIVILIIVIKLFSIILRKYKDWQYEKEQEERQREARRVAEAYQIEIREAEEKRQREIRRVEEERKRKKQEYIRNMINWLRSTESMNCDEELHRMYNVERFFNRFITAFRFLRITKVENIEWRDRKTMRPYIKIKIYNDRLILKYKPTGLETHAKIYYAENVNQEDINQIKSFFNGRVPISAGLRYQVLNRDNHTCQTCGRKSPEVVLHIDHIIPVSRGGPTTIDNLRVLCEECNLGRGDRF
jgi:hypothetical protein